MYASDRIQIFRKKICSPDINIEVCAPNSFGSLLIQSSNLLEMEKKQVNADIFIHMQFVCGFFFFYAIKVSIG